MTAFRLILAGLVCALAVPATVEAQIYAWRDDSGRLVLSDRPLAKGAEMHSFAVREGSTVRTTSRVISKKAERYDHFIVAHSRDQGIRADLVRAVIQAESAYDPWARSFKGAMGLMQLMPATATEYGVVNAYDPEENIRAGVRYLRRLLDKYDNNEELALAAYNAGPTVVDRYGRQVPPYRETRNYVAKIKNTKSPAPSSRVYRIVELIDGHEVVRYTNIKPVDQ
jgi:soluble lytic murein transglycosylase-like protein